MAATQIQIKLVTKQAEYAVPDTVYSLDGNVTGKELNSLVNSLLKESNSGKYDTISFDFLLLGEFLRESLENHLENKASKEEVFEVEYITKSLAPSPENNLVHNDWISDVRISGEWILSGSYDKTLQIWNVNGKSKLTVVGHTAPIKSLAWIKLDNPICSFISTAHDQHAMQWEWNQIKNTANCTYICKGHSRSVECVDINPDKTKFATGSYDTTLKIWSLGNEGESVGGDEDLKRLKTETSKPKFKTSLMTLNGHTEAISAIQWIESNEIYTCSNDCSIRIWDLELGGMKDQLNGSKAFCAISYSPLSKNIISGSTDKHIRLWDPRSKEGLLVKVVFSSHNDWVSSVRWSPINQFQFISGSHDKFVKLWDTRSPKTPLYDISGHEDRIFAIDWSENNYIVSGGADKRVNIFKCQESPAS